MAHHLRSFGLVGTLAWMLLLGLAAPGSPADGFQGFGAGTPGGAGGTVVRVTNLNDAGPGSLRDALAGGHRTIVFDVAGEIVLSSYISVQGAYVTVEGLTAPAPGITLRNAGLVIRGTRGAHDMIVRGIRVRGAPLDGIQIAYGAYNVVIDHVSVHGSGDGDLDITEGSHDVTVSWSIFAEPASGKTMLIKYNPARISLHHNLYVRGFSRNPQVRVDDAGTPAADTTVDMRNNVVWDWGGGFGTLVWYGPRVNVVGNIFGSPSSTTASQQSKGLIVCRGDCDGGNPASFAWAYVEGNLSGHPIPFDINSRGTVDQPFPAPPVDTQDTCTAATLVLAGAGVRPLDPIDAVYLQGVALPCTAGPIPDPTPDPGPDPTPDPSGATSATITVSGLEDDAFEYLPTGGVATLNAKLLVGHDYLVALRFAGPQIPRGARIESAALALYAAASEGGALRLEYRAEAADDSAPLHAEALALSQRPLGAPSVVDVPAAWVAGRYNASPDLAAIIQDVVSRPGWEPGNSITILVRDAGSPYVRRVGTVEIGAPAVLTVTFR